MGLASVFFLGRRFTARPASNWRYPSWCPKPSRLLIAASLRAGELGHLVFCDGLRRG
jgi:hypothetical protein